MFVRCTFDALGLSKRRRDLEVTREALPAMARHAMGDWFLRGNPRRFDNAAEIEQLHELAW